jgi:hypothetical protein
MNHSGRFSWSACLILFCDGFEIPFANGSQMDQVRILLDNLSDWYGDGAANFGWMREAKREHNRRGL